METKKLSVGTRLGYLKQKFSERSLNKPAKSSLYFTLTNLISKGAAFIFTPIFTRILTPEEYGTGSLFSSYLSVAIVIVTLEIPGNVIMRAFQKNRGLENLCIITAAAIPLALTVPCVLLLLILGGALSFPLARTALSVSLASLAFINLYTSACKFLYKWRVSLLIALLQSVMAPLISIALINLGTLGKHGNITIKIGTGAAVTALSALTLFICSLIRGIKEARAATMNAASYLTFAARLYKTLFSLCLPLLPYYLSVMIISQADKLTVSSYLGREALGKYSLSYSAGIALCAVTSGIMSALCPWIMRKVRSGDISRVRAALGTIVAIAVPAIIVFLCAAPETFAVLAPQSYNVALPVLFITATSALPLALSAAFCSIAVAKEKTLSMLLCGIFCAAFATVLNLLLTGSSPLFVPALITASSYITLMISQALSVGKILSKPVVNVNKLLQNVLFLSFSSAVLFTLRDILLPRILIAGAAALYLLYMIYRAKWLLSESDGVYHGSDNRK